MCGNFLGSESRAVMSVAKPGGVFEAQVTPIQEQHIGTILKIGDEERRPAASIQIARFNAHAGERDT